MFNNYDLIFSISGVDHLRLRMPYIYFFRFWWKIHNININFCNVHLQLSVMSVVNYSQIVNFLHFLINIETTRLQQSVTFNLHIICCMQFNTYNKRLFTIKTHIFAIFRRTTDIFFIHLFYFGIKIVRQCLFFLSLQYSIEISLHIDASIIFYYFCQRHFIISKNLRRHSLTGFHHFTFPVLFFVTSLGNVFGGVYFKWGRQWIGLTRNIVPYRSFLGLLSIC